MKPGSTNHLLQKAAENGEFHTLEDGFFYYWPSQGGALSAYQLRVLANHLDKLNAPWQKFIENDPDI